MGHEQKTNTLGKSRKLGKRDHEQSGQIKPKQVSGLACKELRSHHSILTIKWANKLKISRSS